MSNSPSPIAKPNLPEAAVAKVVAKADPVAAPTTGAKVQAAPKPAKAAVAAPAKASKPVAKVAAPAASKAPAQARTEVKVAAKAKPKATSAASVKAQPAAKLAKATKPVAAVLVPATKAPAKIKPVAEVKESKDKKHAGKKPKLVRDSFTFPAADYALIGVLKQRALKAGHDVKKSELLRAGLTALSELSDTALLKALGGVDKLKTGRPAK